MNKSVLMTLALPDGTGAHRMCHQFAQSFIQAGFRVHLVCGQMERFPAAARNLLQQLEELGVEVASEAGFFRARRQPGGQAGGTRPTVPGPGWSSWA